MGATIFEHTVAADTPHAAYTQARDIALYEYGHGGYTGTIAEKAGFRLVGTAKPGTRTDRIVDAVAAADTAQFRTLVDVDPNVTDRALQGLFNDKWGPAVCVDITPITPGVPDGHRTYLFTGWASS